MRRSTGDSIRDWAGLLLFTVAIHLVLQTVLIIVPEHVHSTAAWLLGYTPTPFTVIWGNPLKDTGWDEGVPYDQLFPSPGHWAEAVIGGSPLPMHALFVAAGLYLLQRPGLTQRKLLFQAVYWFIALNLGELVSYMVMRPSGLRGDTGRFNEGLGLSPWPLHVAGSVLIVVALYIYFAGVMYQS